MKTNIIQSQQDLLNKYADEKRKFLYEWKVYTFTDYTLHENDIDIYIIDDTGNKDTWGIESWRMEEFFGWFDSYGHSIEEVPLSESSPKSINKEEPAVKAKTPKKEPKIKKPKKAKTMRNGKVSPLLEPIYEFVKNSKQPVRGIEIADHIGMKQNGMDYYIKKLINAGRIYKTPDKYYTTDKKQAGKITKASPSLAKKKAEPKKESKSHIKPAVLEMVDTSYRIDALLEQMKLSKRFHVAQAEKLDKMIEIWETNI